MTRLLHDAASMALCFHHAICPFGMSSNDQCNSSLSCIDATSLAVLCELTLGGSKLCCLLGSTDTSVESPVGNALLPLLDISEVGVGLGELEAVDGGDDLCRMER